MAKYAAGTIIYNSKGVSKTAKAGVNYIGFSTTKPSTSTSTKTPSTSSGTSSGSTVSSQDYWLKPGESITDYNNRIAAQRGDSATELASMQQKATDYATANPTSAFASRLTSATAPTSPTEITQMDTTKIPALDSTEVNPIGALSVSSGMQAFIDAQQAQLKEQQKRADALALKNQSLMEKTLGTMKNPEDVYNQAWEDTGMSAKDYFATQAKGIKEIDTLNKEYANVQGAMEQQIAQSNDKMASMNFINNQTAQIRRNAEPQLNTISAKISSKAAMLQALQGNFAEARSLVKDAVDAATAGNKFKYDMYSALYEQNVDNFDRVDKAYSDAYTNAMNIALKDYEMQREEKMQIGELMLKYPTAGIDMNGTLDEAFERAGLVAPTSSGESLTADMKNYNLAVETGYKGTFADFLGKGGGSSAGGFFDVMQQAIDAGASPEEAAREAALASENTGIPVDQKTISSWTEIARNMSKTPVVEAAPFENQTISAPTGTEKTSKTQSDLTITGIWNSLFGD